MAGLTERQQRFVDEYLIDLNATQAAIRAGYSARTAQEQSSRLLSNVMVGEAVARAKAERSARIGLTQDRVLEELAAVAFSRMPAFAEWGTGKQMRLRPSDELSEHDAAAVAQVVETEKFIKTTGEDEVLMSRERSIKLHDKVAALVKLGNHLGMFVDRQTISIEVKREAEDLAAELGMTPDQVLKEAGIEVKKR